MIIVMLMVHGINSFQLMRSYLRKFQLSLLSVLLIRGVFGLMMMTII
jgi:hypothetical protein